MIAEAPKYNGVQLLRKPFLPNQISKLPKPYKKDSPKGKCPECGGYHGLPAVHLDYVGHAALTDRLLDTDPGWTWEPLAMTPEGLPRFDASGGLWIRLTVCGVSRLGYGHAEGKSYGDPGMREKEVIGDALRNAAMRFGAALDLWHKGQLHEPDSEAKTDEEKPDDPWTPALRADGYTAANRGIEAYGAWWKTCGAEFRKAAAKSDLHLNFKTLATAKDGASDDSAK